MVKLGICGGGRLLGKLGTLDVGMHERRGV